MNLKTTLLFILCSFTTSLQPIMKSNFLNFASSLRKGESPAVIWEDYCKNRIQVNRGLVSLLRQGTSQDRVDVLYAIDQFERAGRDIMPDTIHILLIDFFKRGQADQAARLFDHFFRDRRVVPNTRSLNIMVENMRELRDTSYALRYLDDFKTFRLQPDNYTVSSLVRMASSAEDVTRTLEQASLRAVLTAPVIRCAVETLGRFGAPEEAVRVSLSMLPQHNESIYDSRKSGDALIAALIRSDTAGPETDSSDQAAQRMNQTAFEVPSRVPQRSKGLEMALQLCLSQSAGDSSGRRVVCSGKGWCAVFTGLQREIRAIEYSLLLDKQTAAPARRSEVATLSRRLAQLKQAHELLQRRLYESDFATEASVVFNGRLCDAILRTYVSDLDQARAVWLKKLLPLAKRCDLLSPGALLEAAEKALDAMMFLAGYNDRADLGLEIAKTARGRAFSRVCMIKLAKSYSRAKAERAALTSYPAEPASRSFGAGISDLATAGLERGIEGELGVLLDCNTGRGSSLKSIRLRFTDPGPTTVTGAGGAEGTQDRRARIKGS